MGLLMASRLRDLDSRGGVAALLGVTERDPGLLPVVERGWSPSTGTCIRIGTGAGDTGTGIAIAADADCGCG
jgi:hypothetical protein